MQASIKAVITRFVPFFHGRGTVQYRQAKARPSMAHERTEMWNARQLFLNRQNGSKVVSQKRSVPEFLNLVFGKTSPKLVFNHWKRAFWASFRENWIYINSGTEKEYKGFFVPSNLPIWRGCVNSLSGSVHTEETRYILTHKKSYTMLNVPTQTYSSSWQANRAIDWWFEGLSRTTCLCLALQYYYRKEKIFFATSVKILCHSWFSWKCYGILEFYFARRTPLWEKEDNGR